MTSWPTFLRRGGHGLFGCSSDSSKFQAQAVCGLRVWGLEFRGLGFRASVCDLVVCVCCVEVFVGLILCRVV